jgi:single-strand DNA-binding protein
MKGINKVILVGAVGQDPDFAFSNNGNPRASFSLATGVKFKDKTTGETQEKTTWHNLVAFGKKAEIVNEYVRKGSRLYIEGTIDNQSYDKDGEKRYFTKIIIQDINLLSSKDDFKSPHNQTHQEPPPNMSDNELDDDIPF